MPSLPVVVEKNIISSFGDGLKNEDSACSTQMFTCL